MHLFIKYTTTNIQNIRNLWSLLLLVVAVLRILLMFLDIVLYVTPVESRIFARKLLRNLKRREERRLPKAIKITTGMNEQ